VLHLGNDPEKGTGECSWKMTKVNHPIGKLEKYREITFKSYLSQELLYHCFEICEYVRVFKIWELRF